MASSILLDNTEMLTEKKIEPLLENLNAQIMLEKLFPFWLQQFHWWFSHFSLIKNEPHSWAARQQQLPEEWNIPYESQGQSSICVLLLLFDAVMNLKPTLRSPIGVCINVILAVKAGSCSSELNCSLNSWSKLTKSQGLGRVSMGKTSTNYTGTVSLVTSMAKDTAQDSILMN